MTEWKRYEKENPPEEGQYLVYRDSGNITAIFKKDKSLGYTWWDSNGYVMWDITHYTEVAE